MRGADCAHNAFANTCDDRLFRRDADESIEMRAYRHARLNFHTDAILRDTVDGCPAHGWVWRVDDFGIDARAIRFEHGLTSPFGCQIDRARAIEIECDTRLVSGDKGKHHMVHIAARQIMRFERIAANIETSFHGRDSVIHNQSDRDFAQPHADHFAQAYWRIGDASAQPETEKIEKNNREHEREKR